MPSLPHERASVLPTAFHMEKTSSSILHPANSKNRAEWVDQKKQGLLLPNAKQAMQYNTTLFIFKKDILVVSQKERTPGDKGRLSCSTSTGPNGRPSSRECCRWNRIVHLNRTQRQTLLKGMLQMEQDCAPQQDPTADPPQGNAGCRWNRIVHLNRTQRQTLLKGMLQMEQDCAPQQDPTADPPQGNVADGTGLCTSTGPNGRPSSRECCRWNRIVQI